MSEFAFWLRVAYSGRCSDSSLSGVWRALYVARWMRQVVVFVLFKVPFWVLLSDVFSL